MLYISLPLFCTTRSTYIFYFSFYYSWCDVLQDFINLINVDVRAAHFLFIFLCRCSARLQRGTSRNFLVTRFMEEMLYVLLFLFPECVRCHSFFTTVATSISHFLTAAIKFSCYSSNEIGLHCFWYLAPRLCLCYPRQRNRKKETALLLLFLISKGPGGYAIYCRNARVLEMQNFKREREPPTNHQWPRKILPSH